MSPVWFTIGIMILILLNLRFTNVNCEREVNFFKKKNTFHLKEIVFDNQPLNSNTLVYATCNTTGSRMIMNCSVFFESFPDCQSASTKICWMDYQVKDQTIVDQFQLKLLFDSRVIFKWLVKNESGIVQYLVYRTINMNTCKFRQTSIMRKTPKSMSNLDDFHVVVYKDTYDVFFRDDNLCADMMCGQCHDKDGRLINGPVPSYLPAIFFEEQTFVCPLVPGSSTLGHFLISSQFSIVSSNYGEIKYLMNYPNGIDAQAFSCENGLLGFCWLTRFNERQVNCTQFNASGDKVVSLIVYLEYKPGTWMAMRNLPGGGFLLITSHCDEDRWCHQNMENVPFYAVEVRPEGEVREISEVRGVDCNYVADIKTSIHSDDAGSIGLTFACHVPQNNAGISHINYITKCVADKFAY